MADRRKVTMTNFVPVPGGFQRHEATDYVELVDVPGYVTDAATRWALVEVSDTPDNGPAGPDGDYVAPVIE